MRWLSNNTLKVMNILIGTIVSQEVNKKNLPHGLFDYNTYEN